MHSTVPVVRAFGAGWIHQRFAGLHAAAQRGTSPASSRSFPSAPAASTWRPLFAQTGSGWFPCQPLGARLETVHFCGLHSHLWHVFLKCAGWPLTAALWPPFQVSDVKRSNHARTGVSTSVHLHYTLGRPITGDTPLAHYCVCHLCRGWPERAFQGRAAEPATWHCRAKALWSWQRSVRTVFNSARMGSEKATSFALSSLGTRTTHALTQLGTPFVTNGSHFALGIPSSADDPSFSLRRLSVLQQNRASTETRVW